MPTFNQTRKLGWGLAHRLTGTWVHGKVSGQICLEWQFWNCHRLSRAWRFHLVQLTLSDNWKGDSGQWGLALWIFKMEAIPGNFASWPAEGILEAQSRGQRVDTPPPEVSCSFHHATLSNFFYLPPNPQFHLIPPSMLVPILQNLLCW